MIKRYLEYSTILTVWYGLNNICLAGDTWNASQNIIWHKLKGLKGYVNLNWIMYSE